jgi:hypothetical protein
VKDGFWGVDTLGGRGGFLEVQLTFAAREMIQLGWKVMMGMWKLWVIYMANVKHRCYEVNTHIHTTV